MIVGLTVLTSASVGVVAGVLLSRLRRGRWVRRHRVVSIVMVYMSYAGVASVAWDWASGIDNFAATFGPFIFALPMVAVGQQLRGRSPASGGTAGP